MTKTVKKLLISLMALAITVCCGIALLGLNQDVAKAESTYEISILGTSLSDSNLTFDSSDNANVTGSVTYSPEENKLTLNNFVFSGPSDVHVINVQKSTSSTLTVELIGDSEITITENTSSWSRAISAFYASEGGNICFVGGGSFTVDNSAFDSSTAALGAGNKIILVYNSQLVGKGYNTAIYYNYSIVAYGENASILATATDPYSTQDPFDSSNIFIYPALARSGGYMYSNRNTQKVEVSFNIDGSDPSSLVSEDRATYAEYKYFYIVPVTLTVSAHKSDEIGVYYNFTPSTLCYGDKVTVTPEPGYVLTNIQYATSTFQPKATLQPDGSYVLDTADANVNYTQYKTIQFWADYAEAKTITKTPSVGGDYVVPSAGAYNEEVTIIPTPNAGYCTDKVTVTSASGNPITVTGPNADGGYTFVMPNEEVSISVEFVQLVTYDVWVAGIQLDSRNTTIDSEDNNAITGTATYDAENNILTLDNFVYSGAGYLYDIVHNSEYDEYYYNYAGIYSEGDLNIVLNGENTLNCAITDEDSDNIYKSCDGINIDGALTIGGGTLNATIEGNAIVANTLTIDNAILNSNSTNVNIYLDGDAIISNSKVFAKGGSPVIAIKENNELKITNSTVVMQSEDGYYGFSYNSVINIDENSVLEISVSNCAIGNNVTVNYSPNSAVYAGENKENAQLVAAPDNTTFAGKYVKIVPTYDIWVAGIRLNAENFIIDSNDESTITGSATYDAENNILTLDNFVYTGEGYSYISNANALIYSTGIDLKIVLKGTNALVGLVDVYEGISIEDGSLMIAGSNEDNETASLELIVENTCICAGGSLSIENVKLTTTTTALPTGNGSTTKVILTFGDLSITNSEVTVIAGDSDGDGIIEFGYTTGIISGGNVEITDSIVTVAANDGGIDADSRMTIDNSTVIIDGGTGGTSAKYTSIKNSTVIISGEIAIKTNTLYGGYFIVSNSNVEISAQEYAIHNLYSNTHLDDGRLHDITGHVIYGGEDKESATILTEQVDIFGNKYLRFAPAGKVTVNYGIDGVDNEEFTIEKGTTLSLETPEIDGYIFIGWYNEDTLETAFDFSTPITEDITIYAKFANYTQDIANINSQINGVKDSITSLQSIIAGKADATELANSVTDLQGKIDALTTNYQSADANQQLEIDALENQVENLITNAIAVLNGKVADIETEIADINSAISSNESDITANAGKITSLTTQLTTLQGLVNSLGDTYIDNTELSSLREELVNADNQIKGLITALTTRVEETESDIASLVANKADATLVTEKVEELKGLIDSLDAVKNNYVAADEELKNQLTTAIATAKQQAIDSATELVNNAKAELTIAINAKADTATVNAKVEELNSAIDTAESLANAYTDGKVTELTSAIATAKQEAIATAENLVNTAKAELNSAIALKADTATLNTKVSELNSAIATAENVAKAYTDGEVDKLTTAIATAKQEAITTAENLVNTAKAELTSAIALKADTATLNAKVEELNSAIDTAENIAKAYTDGEVDKLTTAIATAKQEAITTAENLVNTAKAELNSAIALKADTATLNTKVSELNFAIATAENVAKAYTDGEVDKLTTAIATAKQEAIITAENLVNTAKAELTSAIALKADTATLNAKFTEVESAIAILQELSDGYVSADSALKEELTTLITNTKAEIIELILAGDKANADALEEEIAKLRAEIEALKNATNEDIKEAESNAKVLPTVIASVAALGYVALLVLLIIKRKIVK